MNDFSVADHFRDYFEIIPAKNSKSLEQIFQIRYDVFCREFGYETEQSCHGGMERDDYDDVALHCLIVHRATGVGAGCIRMITATDEPSFLLPMESFCGESLTDPVLHPMCLPRLDVAEGSRFVVHTKFRRRVGENESPFGIVLGKKDSREEQRSFPLLSLALFYAGTALMTILQRQHIFAMLEPRLARRAVILGIPFVQAGQIVDYHGPRAAHYVSVEKILDNIQGDMQNLYQFVYDSLVKV
ncbi:PEP-CTERM/exosortase system-associated acyltransferase [Chromatium okenii]|uniref:PEP-CTERM/exosortase system-associated acyltransferase n=1 Tax=Chromatium okenii TaxID=61644 RepID=UPI001903D7D6|nr:PEP-CTERM/exosortase system-associated acyltransferase [Chromatium okenii]